MCSTRNELGKVGFKQKVTEQFGKKRTTRERKPASGEFKSLTIIRFVLCSTRDVRKLIKFSKYRTLRFGGL